MALFKLTKSQRRRLVDLASYTCDSTTLRRSQALIWLDDGERVAAVAERLRVSRQVIYQWISLYHQESPSDLAIRLAVGMRSGRPPTVKGVIDPFIDEVIDHDPRTYDYNSTVWTAPLLSHYLKSQHGPIACNWYRHRLTDATIAAIKGWSFSDDNFIKHQDDGALTLF